MNYSTPFSRLLAEAPDDELGNSTFLKIVIRREAGLSQGTIEERAIELVWNALGTIGNGGFEYLLEGTVSSDSQFQDMAEAHQSIGLTRCYEAFQNARALFPGGHIPSASRERTRLYKEADETARDNVSRLYWSQEATIIRNVAQYIRDNVATLGNLDHLPPSE